MPKLVSPAPVPVLPSLLPSSPPVSALRLGLCLCELVGISTLVGLSKKHPKPANDAHPHTFFRALLLSLSVSWGWVHISVGTVLRFLATAGHSSERRD